LSQFEEHTFDRYTVDCEEKRRTRQTANIIVSVVSLEFFHVADSIYNYEVNGLQRPATRSLAMPITHTIVEKKKREIQEKKRSFVETSM
jgi:hypothetical protein